MKTHLHSELFFFIFLYLSLFFFRLLYFSVPNKNGFMSGKDEPNIADLEAFGTLAMLEGTPVFPDMIANTSIKKWYNKMRKTVGDKQSTSVDEGCFIQANP